MIGDSVTAGLNDRDDTWPQQLARSSAVEVLDASQPGATVLSALKQGKLLTGKAGVLLLEIGGNDVLEGLPIDQFEHDLDLLLSDIATVNRMVVMFELPLPPFCSKYGIAQRRLAIRHRVKLIPKRVFTKNLTVSGATVDGIHLSERGQTLFMTTIKTLIGNLWPSGMGTYQRLEERRNG